MGHLAAQAVEVGESGTAGRVRIQAQRGGPLSVQNDPVHTQSADTEAQSRLEGEVRARERE